MEINIIDKVEEKCEINLEWYYHSTCYDIEKYKCILEKGIKCNHLLNKTWCGRYNGPYYISLSKITIPDNVTFLNYACSENPSFIIDGINPIECKRIHEYEKYIKTVDPRRIGNFNGEYQYYYWIERKYIKAILFNLYDYINYFKNLKQQHTIIIEELISLIALLQELEIDIPIYDYSRRDNVQAHKIDKDKAKYYLKNL